MAIRRRMVILPSGPRAAVCVPSPAPAAPAAFAAVATATEARALLDELGDLRALLLGQRVVDLAERLDGGAPGLADGGVVLHEDVGDRGLVEGLAADHVGEVLTRPLEIAP